MTIASNTAFSGPYLGNGVTTQFDYKFKIFDKSHIVVTLHESDGAVILDEGVHYTLTGVGQAGGGQVVMGMAPAAGQELTIRRNVPFVQELDLENQGAFYAEVIEQAFDVGVMRDQQLKEKLDRAITVPENVDWQAKDQLVSDIGKLAGQAQDISELVAMKAAITEILGIKTQVTTVAGIANNINTVAGIAGDVTVVKNNVTNIAAVKNNAANINAVASNMTKVNTVAINMNTVNGVAVNLPNINAVASNMTKVNAVVSNATNVNTVASNGSNITTVADNIANVNTVANNMDNITAVRNNESNINAVKNNEANINVVKGMKAYINYVVGMADEINAVANMDVGEIWAAGNAAYQWAMRAEDVAVNDGSNPVGYSSYHWAQKAAASAATASAIADFNPDDYLPKTGGTVTGALTVNNQFIVSGRILSGYGFRIELGSEVAEFRSNGEITGVTWMEWGSDFAKAAIAARIESRATAIADARINALVNNMINTKINAFKASNPIFGNGLRVKGHIKATGNVQAYIPVTQIDDEEDDEQ